MNHALSTISSSTAMVSVIEQILCQIDTMMEEVMLGGGVPEREIRKLGCELELIKSVVRDAEKMKNNEESARAWLQQLRDVLFEVEDLLDSWTVKKQRAQIGKVCHLNCFPSCLVSNMYGDIGPQIKKINELIVDLGVEKARRELPGLDMPLVLNELEVLGRDSDKETLIELTVTDMPMILDELEVLGRDSDKEILISKILWDGDSEDDVPNVVSIVGVGGIGKTTLAESVYNSDAVIGHFDIRIWVCVSQNSLDAVRLAMDILGEIEGGAPNLLQLETAARKIRNSLKGKRFLIVLDDVWKVDFRDYEPLFNSLRVGAAGSKILVTTRNKSATEVMGSSYDLHLGSLSEQDSWSLFRKKAFVPEREELERYGKEIAKKCRGLPLAIKVVGGLMRFKKSLQDWEDVLNSGFWDMEAAAGPIPPLKLSYTHLPSALRQCFSYLALFAKDCVIMANNLIQLWMAQGFLLSTDKNVEMESIGQDYLQHLAMKSFFQDLVMDKKNGRRILSFKMHDVVRDLACYVATEIDCLVMTEFNTGFRHRMKSNTRHLTVIRAQDTQFPSLLNVEKLFTLRVVPLFDSPPSTDELDQIQPDLLRRAASLKALDLSRNRIAHLPKDISNLTVLEYLNLSHNPIWELPESVCDLHSLKTLDLSSCEHLQRLPSRIRELRKLRHLMIDCTDSLRTLPEGIGRLVCLRMLSKFIITAGNDATYGLRYLKHLNNLQGRLRIEGLGYATDANDAKKADLRKKIHLTDLEMDFSPSTQAAGGENEVIEALEVHENLQSLRISSYGGTKLPHWIMKLTNLQQLYLQDCHKCWNLPPLGRLPSLVTLQLEGVEAINCLGNDLNGEGTTPAFPKLEKLKFSKMENWEEWDVKIAQDGAEIMPRLRCLKVSDCSKLRELPPLIVQKRSLRKLHINSCGLLLQRYNREETGEDWSKISHIPEICFSK